MDWITGITLGIALLGAFLGILNTWNTFDQRRVRLKVSPAFAIASNGAVGYSIQVTNFSAFAVTIMEVGFSLPGRKRVLVRSPVFVDGKPWPRRLESHEAVSVYFDPSDAPGSAYPDIQKAYAHTACGHFAYGISPSLRQLRETGGRI